MKRTKHSSVVIIAASLGVFSAAHAQLITEQYIPIGESPGISGERSYIGEIVAVSSRDREIRVDTAQGSRTFTVTNDTFVWLDRSSSNGVNTEGRFADCDVGRVVEILPMREGAEVAYWVKIRAD